jgi:hypothetical protein
MIVSVFVNGPPPGSVPSVQIVLAVPPAFVVVEDGDAVPAVAPPPLAVNDTACPVTTLPYWSFTTTVIEIALAYPWGLAGAGPTRVKVFGGPATTDTALTLEGKGPAMR